MPLTQEEADRLAEVLRTADRGCRICVYSICENASLAKLGFTFQVTDNIVSFSDDEEDEKPWTNYGP